MTDAPYVLTPAAVQSLRDSVRHRLSNHALALSPDAAFIIYGAPHYILHAYGAVQAVSLDPAPLLAALRCEQAEPGFIRRILDPSTDCNVASLAPDAYATAKRQQDAERARWSTASPPTPKPASAAATS